MLALQNLDNKYKSIMKWVKVDGIVSQKSNLLQQQN